MFSFWRGGEGLRGHAAGSFASFLGLGFNFFSFVFVFDIGTVAVSAYPATNRPTKLASKIILVCFISNPFIYYIIALL
jgi:hypothetical protein